MGEKNRIFALNLKYYLWEKKIASSDFAENLGYSLLDVEKLCDARLFTTEEDVKDIAGYFAVEPNISL